MTEEELLGQYGYIPPKQEISAPAANEVDLTQYGYVPPESEEGIGKSIAYAGPRVLKDLGDLILEKIRGIPSTIEQAKTEVPGLLQSMIKHPGSLSLMNNGLNRQMIAGGNEAINDIAQTPLNIAKYGQNRLHLVPAAVTKGLSMVTPEDTTQAIDQIFGQPKQPGEALGRGIMRNLPVEIPLVAAGRALNPLKLRTGNIARDVVRTRNDARTTARNDYADFLTNAHQSGAGQTLPNAIGQIDFNTALINEPRKVRARVAEFQNNPNVITAHEAKSDLLKIQRKLTKKNETHGLIGNEIDQLDAVSDAIGRIEGNMFTDAHGAINQEMAGNYRNLQEAYQANVIPYTRNKALNEYIRGERLADELVPSLMRGKFAAQVGNRHRPLMIRRWMKNHPKTTIAGGLAAASAGGLPLLPALLKYLSGGEGHE